MESAKTNDCSCCTVLVGGAVIGLYFLFLVLISQILRFTVCEIGGLFEIKSGCGPGIMWFIPVPGLSACAAFFTVFRLWPNISAKVVTLVFIIGCMCWSILFYIIAILLEATLVALVYAGFIALPTLASAFIIAVHLWKTVFMRVMAFLVITGFIIWSILFIIFTINLHALEISATYMLFTVIPIMLMAYFLRRGKFHLSN